MRAVVQRVKGASVSVEKQRVSEIGPGLLVLVGVAKEDGEEDAAWMARKLTGLRIFEDAAGKMNHDVRQAGGGVLAVSQFTLLGDTRKGNRPGFDRAARPEEAQPLYEKLCALLEAEGLPVGRGRFGAHMEVQLTNDGPVTVLLDSKKES